MEVVRELEADILCLQEVDNYHSFWSGQLKELGYTGKYKQRNTDTKNDGCATFFRTDKFEEVCHDSIEFDRVQDEGGKRPDFATHNVALLVLLRPTSQEGGCICVANAHLFWDPMYEDVKLAQARALVKAAEDLVQEHAPNVPTPVILAGDFNSMPDSVVYKFLTRDAAFSSSYVACGKPQGWSVDSEFADKGTSRTKTNSDTHTHTHAENTLTNTDARIHTHTENGGGGGDGGSRGGGMSGRSRGLRTSAPEFVAGDWRESV
jgi:mRNA deadenylase 3'-5' endonuclease subunit Ccr4